MSDGTFISPESNPSPPPPTLPFRLPADYYSTPAEAKPLFPRWVPLGCGIAAAALIVILFGAGILASHGFVGRGMDFFLGTLEDQMSGMYGGDVPEASRKALESEMDALRANIRAEKVPVANLDPVMTTLREAISDKKLTNAEVEKLRKAIREANTPGPSKR